MSQDFYRLFGLGGTDKAIANVDRSGIAMAAIQGLYEEHKALEKRVAELEKLVEALLDAGGPALGMRSDPK